MDGGDGRNYSWEAKKRADRQVGPRDQVPGPGDWVMTKKWALLRVDFTSSICGVTDSDARASSDIGSFPDDRRTEVNDLRPATLIELL